MTEQQDRNDSPPPRTGEPADAPRFRPRDQFWPYVDLTEEPSPDELARLDPDLQAALYENPPPRPFTFTVVFGAFEGADYARAVDLASRTSDYEALGEGPGVRHRARFRPEQVLALRDLWHIVGSVGSSEVLVDDRPVPYARELWLPLLWFLIPR